jgi:flagellar biogenesis protein FliO
MSILMLLVRVTGSLVVVVVLALLTARFVRGTARGQLSGDLQVRGRVGLTRDSAAVVLSSSGRRLLVGVSSTQITLLADLGPDRDASEQPVEQPREQPRERRRIIPERNPRQPVIPKQRQPESSQVQITQVPLSRRAARELRQNRRIAVPPTQRGSGSVLDPRTWRQGLEALRDFTARRR